jgi:tetratricopeptide (TPR) repeat protein
MACAALAATLLFSTAALADDPDALYANRTTIADARRAAAIWQAALDKSPGDFEAAWKRARSAYWLGGHEPDQATRDREYEAGMAAARKAIAAQPARPEGHFWLAAVMGGYAQDHGLKGGLKYRGTIRDELETVLKMDPGFQQGSADRALGRWYFQVPGLFGGSKKESEKHLRAALAYNPRSIVTRLFLAETLDALGRKDDAIAELRQIETLSPDPDWLPEDREFKAQARQMLSKLTSH